MIKETNAYTVPLTLQVLNAFRQAPAWAGERNFKPALVARLRAEYEAGRFHSVDWATAMLHGVLYRMNGQHSSTFLIELERDFPGALKRLGIKVHFTEFECGTRNDLHSLFMCFDSRQSARSGIDGVGVNMTAYPQLHTVPRAVASRLVTGMAMFFCFRDTRSMAKISAGERATYINEDPNFIIDAATLGKERAFCSSPIGAAIYATWEQTVKPQTQHIIRPITQQELSQSPLPPPLQAFKRWKCFWDSVKDGSVPDTDAPSRVLAKFHDQTRKLRTKADVRVKYAKAILAWNAYCRGRTSKLRYSANAPIPTPLRIT